MPDRSTGMGGSIGQRLKRCISPRVADGRENEVAEAIKGLAGALGIAYMTLSIISESGLATQPHLGI